MIDDLYCASHCIVSLLKQNDPTRLGTQIFPGYIFRRSLSHYVTT